VTVSSFFHAPGCHDAVNKLERLMSLQSPLHFVPDVLAVFIMNEAVPNPRSLVFGGMGAYLLMRSGGSQVDIRRSGV